MAFLVGNEVFPVENEAFPVRNEVFPVANRAFPDRNEAIVVRNAVVQRPEIPITVCYSKSYGQYSVPTGSEKCYPVLNHAEIVFILIKALSQICLRIAKI